MSDNPGELQFSRTIPGEPEDVYYAFSTPQGWRDWLVEASLFRTPAGKSYHLSWGTGWFASGEVKQLDRPQRVVLSWSGKGDPGETQVSIALEAADGGTKVEITHSGFGEGPGWEAARQQASHGWEVGLENLESIFDTGADLRVTQRPMLGIMGSDFNERIAAEIGVPVSQGARIQTAIEGMGPALAGMQGGDVIVEMDGVEMRDWLDLGKVLRAHKAGDEIGVSFYRGPEKHEVKMKLSKRPIPETPLDPVEFAERLQQVNEEVMGELRAALEGVSEQEADFAPTNEWSAKQIMAHLIMGEEGNHIMISNLLQDGQPQYPDGGENRNESVNALVEVTPTIQGLMDRLALAQRETVALFRKSIVLRKRPGVMWRMGSYFLHYPGSHEREHMEQMKGTLEQARAAEPEPA